MKLLPQIRLRTFFLIFVCAAVGLTCATSPPAESPFLKSLGIHFPQLNIHYGLLSAAAMVMVVGLVQQVRALARWKPPEIATDSGLSFARTYAIGWRSTLATMICICLAARILTARQFLNIPEHRDLYTEEAFPEAILLACAIVVLFVSLRRWAKTADQTSTTRPAKVAITSAISLALILIILPDRGLITYLVHIATAGIEHYQPGRFQRAGTFPNQQAEGYRLFWLSISATVAVVVAATGLALARTATLATKTLVAVVASCLALLLASATFCGWYFSTEYPRISPDFATAGLASNWLDWIGGGIVAAIAISATAYKWTPRKRSPTVRIPLDSSSTGQLFPYESSLCLLLFFGAAVAQVIARAQEFRISFMGLYYLLSALLYGSTAYLMLASAILCSQISWIRWRKRKETIIWELNDLDRRQFMWNWAAIALVTVVAIPTFSIYGFAFWLGPWYLYGS